MFFTNAEIGANKVNSGTKMQKCAVGGKAQFSLFENKRMKKDIIWSNQIWFSQILKKNI